MRNVPGIGVVAAIVGAVVVAAAACTGGRNPGPPPPSAPAGQSAPAPAPTTAAPAPTPDPTPGPKEFGLTEEEFVAHVERVQSVLADCMSRAGFEYVPVDVATIEKAQESVRREPGLSDLGFRRKWGYSATTRFDDPVRTIGLGPNAQIIERLGEADRNAYEQILFGENRDSDFVFALDEEDFSATGGCTREAVAAAFTPDQLTGTYLNPKDLLIAADPRVARAQDAWATCMQDGGYNVVGDQDQIIDDFERRLAALTEGEDPETLTGERLDRLRTLQAEEIAVALKDAECDDKHLEPVVVKVEREVLGR